MLGFGFVVIFGFRCQRTVGVLAFYECAGSVRLPRLGCTRFRFRNRAGLIDESSVHFSISEISSGLRKSPCLEASYSSKADFHTFGSFSSLMSRWLMLLFWSCSGDARHWPTLELASGDSLDHSKSDYWHLLALYLKISPSSTFGPSCVASPSLYLAFWKFNKLDREICWNSWTAWWLILSLLVSRSAVASS